MSRQSSSLGRLSAPQHHVTIVSKPAASDRPAANQVKARSTSADRPADTSAVASALLDDSDVNGTAPTSSVQLSINVASESEQSSDEWTESAWLSRGLTKARSVRKPRCAQQTLLGVSSGQSQSSAAVAAASHSAPVSAKRSLSSALGSSGSGDSAPKRAKSSVGLAAIDELKRSPAKTALASLQLRWQHQQSIYPPFFSFSSSLPAMLDSLLPSVLAAQKQLAQVLHQVMTDHAGRTAYWRERRAQVDWQFGEDGALDLNVSTSVGTGLGQENQVVLVD